MVSKKITDHTSKKALVQGRREGGEEEEKSGALASRYASTQSPPPNLCQG